MRTSGCGASPGLRAAWKPWGAWDGTGGCGRNVDIQGKLPGRGQETQSGVEKEQCNPLPFYSSLYPSSPRWFSFCASILSSSASSSFPVLFLLPLLHPSSLSQFLFLSSLSLLSLLSLTESLLPETRNQARVCSNTGLRRYLVEFPFLDNPGN